MSNKELNPVVMLQEDFELLRHYAGNADAEMSLAGELGRATVVNRDAFPPYTVRIGSKVSVLDLSSNKVVELTLVMPGQADIRQQKVSILTPMGAALIGFRKGDEVQWQLPGGMKRFRILDVSNPGMK